MTVHWNSRRGFSGGLNTASSAEEKALGLEHEPPSLVNFLLAMRKVPASRAAAVARGKKLLADAKYPSREVLRKVARLLVRHMDKPQGL